jgi:cell division septum initiation protein DivIVA
MEVDNLLESMEEMIENSKGIPFTGGNKAIIDRKEALDYINEIRLKLPEEVKQARWVKEERTRILMEAQKEAEGIVKEAENRIIAMVDENEITRKAYEQKNEIIKTANEMAREISNGTKEHADAILEKIEMLLVDTLKTIQNNRKELQ